MNKRIKEIRKSTGLSQTEFGDKLGLARNTIANYEGGTREPNDAIIKLICREFNVNYEWLVNSTGSMFVELSREEEIAKYFGTLLKDDDMEFQKKFIRALSKLSVDEWKMIEDFIDELKKD